MDNFQRLLLYYVSVTLVDTAYVRLYNSVGEEGRTMSQMFNRLRTARHPASRRAYIAVILFSAIILIFFGMSEMTKKEVTVNSGGDVLTVQTHENTVEELLAGLDIEIKDQDLVEPSIHTELVSDMEIVYQKAEKVTVNVGNEVKAVYTTEKTVHELLQDLGYTYRDEDHLIPAGESPIEEDLSVYYTPAVEVKIAFDGKEESHWSTSATVADFLKEANVTIGDDDLVQPGLNEELHEGLSVQLVRVEKVTDVIEETTAYETVREDDDELNEGVERVVEQGERGQRALHYSITHEDGVEVARELVKTEVLSDAKDRVVAVGTKPEQAKQYVSETRTANENVTQTSSQESAPSEAKENNKKTMQMAATAYTAECDGCSGITATGIDLNNNRNQKIIAVDPSVIPLGTRVHVEGYGEAIAGDTGGAIKGNKIDLHVATKEEATRFGRKTVAVTILE